MVFAGNGRRSCGSIFPDGKNRGKMERYSFIFPFPGGTSGTVLLWSFGNMDRKRGLVWDALRLLKKIMVTSRNGIFFGSFFIYMGGWTARRYEKIRLNTWAAWLGAVISAVLFGYEEVWLQRLGFVREGDMYFIHLYFKFIYRQFLGDYNESGWGLFLFTFCNTLFFAYLLCRIEMRKKKSRLC